MKKNPYMSAWLSSANSVTGPARGQMMAEMQTIQMQMMQDWMNMWVGVWFPGVRAGRQKRKR